MNISHAANNIESLTTYTEALLQKLEAHKKDVDKKKPHYQLAATNLNRLKNKK